MFSDNNNLPPEVRKALDTIKGFVQTEGFHLIYFPESITPNQRQDYINKMQELSIIKDDDTVIASSNISSDFEVQDLDITEKEIFDRCSKWAFEQGCDFIACTEYLENFRVSDQYIERINNPCIQIRKYPNFRWRYNSEPRTPCLDPGARFVIGFYHEFGITLLGYYLQEVASNTPGDIQIRGEFAGGVSLLPEQFLPGKDWPSSDLLFCIPPFVAKPTHVTAHDERLLQALLKDDTPSGFLFWDDVFNGE